MQQQLINGIGENCAQAYAKSMLWKWNFKGHKWCLSSDASHISIKCEQYANTESVKCQQMKKKKNPLIIPFILEITGTGF